MSNEQFEGQFHDFITQMGDQMIKTGEILQKNAQRMVFDMQRQAVLAKEFSDVFSQLGHHPELVQRFNQSLLDQMSSQMLSTENNDKKSADKRFKDDAWNQLGFSQLKNGYLSYCQALQKLIEDIPDLEPAKKERVLFYLRQWLSSISPSNFAMTNPVVLNEVMNTGGMNLINGMKNYLDDWERGEGLHSIRMTDLDAFKPGVNLAMTPGFVVYENKLMQLIQYSPQTDKVSQRPLLIVPPWINKYYILDLQPHNSLVNWAVSQGQTVFMVSWVNPDVSLRDMDFKDYLELGVLEAVDAIEEVTGQSSINALGYCLGGTLLGTALSYLSSKNDKRIYSATFLTTLLDFTYPGELGCFLNQEQFDILDKQMQDEGVLDGRSLAMAYNMLRENDLHWSYHVNNYLLGKEPPAFDLLYWNSDATNLPSAMHRFYLKNMYIDNKLKDPGGLTINGVEIDLRNIDIPCYFLSAEKDHIALWKSTYLGAELMKGDVDFVLAGSGHVAGVINPAESGKYSFYTNNELKPSAEEWLASADSNTGSWWSHWMTWLKNHGGEEVEARNAENGTTKLIEPAPGKYVLKTLS